MLLWFWIRAFGATEKLFNTDPEEEVQYRLLGADEADINNGSISITSPMARSPVRVTVGAICDNVS